MLRQVSLRRNLPLVLRLVGATLSGAMLAASFPPMADSSTAWAALVPLIMVARFCGPGAAFFWGLFSGSVFWLISVSWLLRLGKTGGPWPLVVLGWVLLAVYCAAFIGAFTAVVAALFRLIDKHVRPAPGDRAVDVAPTDGGRASPRAGSVARVGMVLAIPVLWVGFEYLRGVLFTGFPWNALGVSQFQNTPVIQIAEWGGVYAVSAVVAVMNAALAMMLLRFIDSYRIGRQGRLQFDLMTGLLVCALCWMWGVRRARSIAGAGTPHTEVRIAAVQPNVEQLKKWPEAFHDHVYEAVRSRTEMVSVGKPDLIVWPETAVPGQLSLDPDYCTVDTKQFVDEMAALGAPLLVGSIEMGPGPVPAAGPRYLPDGRPDIVTMLIKGELAIYNSSFLCSTNGIAERYRKQHLVPFGEYLPLDKKLRLLQRIAPVGYSCTPGKVATVFRLGIREGADISFTTLICFEDIVASLARKAVRNGARLLINQTNDAWFDGSAGAVQHMTHCVFRCVENRVPAVRCANTGVTCHIDKMGRIDTVTRDMLLSGETGMVNYRMARVVLEGEEMPLTFYTRHGDLPFAIPCAAASAIGLGMLVLRWLRKKKLAT